MITLSPSQQTTLNEFREFLNDTEKTEFLIAGFAGSGKSFLVKYLVEVVEREFKVLQMLDSKAFMPTMYFTATTNKAANVLTGLLGRPAETIHKLLGLSVKNDYTKGTVELFQKSDPKNLIHSIVFIDEASMVTRDLLHIIRKTSQKFENSKVVYIGDNYQLPPVKESMCPVFQSNIPKYFLTEIQRQIADSPIIQLASQYREMLDDHTLGWPEIIPDNKIIFHYTNKDDWFKAVQTAFLPIHDVDAVKVLAWSNDRVREYNTWIRNFSGQTGDFALRETVQTNKPLQYKERVLAPTDSAHIITGIQAYTQDDIEGYKIELHDLLNSNNYSVFQPKDWKKANQLAASYAKRAKQTLTEEHRRKFWQDFFAIKNEWADLRAVHAQTVHKAQGSTYGDVFIDLTNIGKNNKWQEVARLVYVAITRASNSVHIFGNLQNRYAKKPIINLQEIYQNAAQN